MSFYGQIINLISERYNISFLYDLMFDKRIGCFIYGGFLRDIILGRKWKDLDIRIVVSEKSFQKREDIVENKIKKYCTDKYFKFRVDKSGIFSVIRFVPEGSVSNNYIDFTVSDRFGHPRSDYTINDIFYDLKEKRLIDRGGNGIRHIREKVIDTVIEPETQFELCSWELPRAIKAAVQFGFEIHPRVCRAIKNGKKEVYEVINQINKHKDNEWSEYLLSCLFGGLSHNPCHYFEFGKKLYVFEHIARCLNFEITGEILSAGQRMKISELKNPFNSFNYCDLEHALSILLSVLTDIIFEFDRQERFDDVRNIFNLCGKKMENDFPINCEKIVYVGAS